jgi:hypothetical protein
MISRIEADRTTGRPRVEVGFREPSGGRSMGEGVNLIGVVIAAVVNMVVAALWYSPLLFGKTWMGSVGQSAATLQSAAPRGYALAGIASLVAAFTLASSLAGFQMDGFVEGMLLGLEYGVGIVAMYILSIMAFEARPLRLILVDVGYAVIALAAVGGVLGAM